MVKGEYSSYKDLPVMLYQVQTKYRDEARPRAGILRGREFVMKDSYSFDLDDEGLQRSYDLHREAYVAHLRAGSAWTTGSCRRQRRDGRQRVEEFLAAAPTGEDTFVHCTSCDYAANTEAVQLQAADAQDRPAAPCEVLDTPDTPHRDARRRCAASVTSSRQRHAKNVVVPLRWPDGKAPAAGRRRARHREVDVKRLEANVSPPRCCRSTSSTSSRWFKGYIGPQGLEGVATSSTRCRAAAPGHRANSSGSTP
jgi:prolyl-tRNA synthetase